MIQFFAAVAADDQLWIRTREGIALVETCTVKKSSSSAHDKMMPIRHKASDRVAKLWRQPPLQLFNSRRAKQKAEAELLKPYFFLLAHRIFSSRGH